MTLRYKKHEPLLLKTHPEFNERWLQKQLEADPSVLGLGDLAVIDRERVQGKAGRLDLLLADLEESRRYEVELMLGATDPSHIIRTIEYWDIERRRYPAYDHVAVLVAEDITSRFLNVLGLFAGSIPLVAIQLNALRVDDVIVLNFVRVLDQTELRTDDTDEAERAQTDRAYWEARCGASTLKVVDETLKLINELGATPQQLNYNRYWIGLTDGVRTRNFIMFRPRKRHVRVGIEVEDKESWASRLEDAGLDASVRQKRVWVNVGSATAAQNGEIWRELIAEAVARHEAA